MATAEVIAKALLQEPGTVRDLHRRTGINIHTCRARLYDMVGSGHARLESGKGSGKSQFSLVRMPVFVNGRRADYRMETTPPPNTCRTVVLTSFRIFIKFRGRLPSLDQLKTELSMSRATAYRWRAALIVAGLRE